jgi:hypothetical protein
MTTTRAAAWLLGVSHSRVCQLVRRGRFRVIGLASLGGRRLRIVDPRDVTAYAESRALRTGKRWAVTDFELLEARQRGGSRGPERRFGRQIELGKVRQGVF